MVSVVVDGVLFNFRAAVIVDDGYALLHRADYEDFWSLPARQPARRARTAGGGR